MEQVYFGYVPEIDCVKKYLENLWHLLPICNLPIIKQRNTDGCRQLFL